METTGMTYLSQNTPTPSPMIGILNRAVVKSHSATADRDYTTKASLWGTCPRLPARGLHEKVH